MGEARRRKLAGETTPKGDKWRLYKPSRCARWIAIGGEYVRARRK